MVLTLEQLTRTVAELQAAASGEIGDHGRHGPARRKRRRGVRRVQQVQDDAPVVGNDDDDDTGMPAMATAIKDLTTMVARLQPAPVRQQRRNSSGDGVSLSESSEPDGASDDEDSSSADESSADSDDEDTEPTSDASDESDDSDSDARGNSEPSSSGSSSGSDVSEEDATEATIDMDGMTTEEYDPQEKCQIFRIPYRYAFS
ncbi:hypothetical protein PC116_g19022 [Phytophthora cactorum]|uniref:Uncharacterized protein n=1 Tax=Phytophthora cactorum TaxID=29920 RepID=A0A8T0YL55_9STRA|nr:hypothetical protein PC112_g14805 [Phytophthora cactorum]KAG2852441.1 hypothetical protein PC113_g15030 [Phytophthora cactorum]KAG2923702.1 hypothetical protein PC117_g15662 [Phytophthora cactorum]KAG2941699.1 hypothetical protein PC115_g1821 [Phytophthora cactorum]KAG2997902.1 hypothetical protein PC118_g1601 [Phytophthora cactorum]